MLIDAGANIDDIVDGSTPLHIAVENQHEEVVDVLLKKKANVNLRNAKGEKPSDIAFRKALVDREWSIYNKFPT